MGELSLPTLDSLTDWHVGQIDNDLNEVRFVLADKEEARAWAMWVLTRPPLQDEP